MELLTHILLSFREKRQRLDPKDYTIGDLTGETVAKLPGEINGQQFIIQNNKVRTIKFINNSYVLLCKGYL